MTQQFVPLTADRARVFFDDNGKPRDNSRCPTCSQTSHFVIESNGQTMRFKSLSCPHAFEAPSPA